METRDMIRWFKKGWVLVLAVMVVNFLAGLFKLTTLSKLVETIAMNPAGAVTAILATALLSLLFMLVLYPLIIGWLIEEIDRKVRK